MAVLLEIENLTVDYRMPGGWLRALEMEHLAVDRGQVVGLVGESGCGKSSAGLALLRLLPPGLARVGGSARFAGVDLLSLPEAQLRQIRGRRIAMVFQDPATALNPVFTVGEQVARVVRVHHRVSWREAYRRAQEVFDLVGLPDPEAMLRRYPHQLSGGQRQRVAIAAAVACEPELLIADEPTTALDVTVEAQVLELLAGLQQRLGMAMILISHDLELVGRYCQRVAVLYAGRVVEEGAAGALFEEPLHPYTRGLLASVPERGRPLQPIPGTVPDLRQPPPGCRFASRCPLVQAECQTRDPRLLPVGGRRVACPVVVEGVRAGA
ncbi:oligopeptide/dipeptide ABC transporter, ATPase subunit [Thermaerobacter marianensis DSM 12885]|uniref:Oligopeptide/dipeptide ABC transporter, ATPase subunit n=1 Tax=Thermaerobacter marianensis (strain ATCC 700841 / DSM 12885 / JCM 10246 / 7p75a) TaxID=644966 RepID=E6SIT3_THEM7|nr:ABC transporter ATP-binding protein [Thermaerobacter marianensis]ADU52027.1 oligopeptide/dipeptide ABC transporter, ATPase subunit [Thermaerobacter marianensis DSM 12885]